MTTRRGASDRLLVLDRGSRAAWRVRLGDVVLEPVVPSVGDQVAGEFAAVVWGDPPFAMALDRLEAFGAPRVVSSRGEVVAAARALGLAAHRILGLQPALVQRALTGDPDWVAVPVGTVDLATGEVWSDQPSRLTDTERRLLRLLVARPEGVEREVIHRDVFGYGPAVVSRSIDAAVARLRRKVGAGCVVTAYARGYRFVPAVPPPTASPPPPCPTRRHQLGEALVDLDRRTARVAGLESPLTEQNVRLIEILEGARPGRVDRRTIGRALGIRDRAVTDAVRRLRQKIEVDPADPQIVVASVGGYRLGLEPVGIGGPADRRALASLAAFAGPFSLEAAAEVLGDPAVVRDLVDRGLLTETGADRYRPAVEVGPPPALARCAHARWVTRLAGAAIEARGRAPMLPEPAELLRAHAELEPTHPDDAAMVAAAVALLVDLPPGERLVWIDRAQGRPPTRCAALLWVARASSELALGRPADAERSSLEGCRTEPPVASAYTTAHLLAVLRGDADAARSRLEEAEARFPPGARPMSRASIAREWAWWAIRQGDPAEAQRRALEALALLAAEVRAPGHSLGRANRGVIETHGHLLQVLAVALHRQGHLDDALEAVDEAVSELAELPRRASWRMARMTRSEVLFSLGRLGQARAEIEDILAEADRLGFAEHAALAAGHLLSIAVAAGDREAARGLIEARGPGIRAGGHVDAIAALDRACAAMAGH